MSQNMIALKRQLMQSKLSVLMPRKFSQVGGHRGPEIALRRAAASPAPLVTAPNSYRLRYTCLTFNNIMTLKSGLQVPV